MPVDSKIRNTYSSQFVPLPLELFARANEKDQAVQDSQVALTNQQSDANWKLTGTTAEDNAKIAEIRTGFDVAASELANKDLTQRDNQSSVTSLIKGVSRDKDLNTIMSNTAKYQEWQKNSEEMKKAGNYHKANDMGIESFARYAANGGYKSGLSIDSNVFKYEDSEPVRKQFFDDMVKLGADQIGRVGEISYKFGYEGISEARIGKQAYAAIGAYMGTTAAAQDGRMYDMAVRQTNPKNLTKEGQLMRNGKAFSKEDYVLDGFMKSGMERAGMSYSSGEAEARNANAKAKREKEDFTFGTLQTQGQSTMATGGFTFNDDDYDAKGNFTGSGKTMMEAWKTNSGITSAIGDYFTSKDFNTADPKDQRKALLGAAARLNGMSDINYVKEKAGPDSKITTTFHSIPTKQQPAANQQFYDMQRNTGVFNNMPVMDITTGKQGSMVEILRQLSKDGQLQNKKGEVIKLSDNPTIAEAQQALEGGIGVIGKQDPNHYSAKSYVIGIGGRNIAIDMTYGGTQLRDVTKEELAQSEYQKLKVSPIIEGEGKKAVIKWYNERTFKGKDGNTYNAGSTYATPLSEINTIR